MVNISSRLKRLASGGAVAALLVAGGLAVTAAPASAHGGMVYPADRVYQCYLNGLEGSAAAGQGGNMLPTNPVCQDALAVGSYSFYTWYGNLLPQVAGRHQEQIADGSLCGPSKQFAAYNAVSTHWPTTQLQSGQQLELRYAAKAPHPGWWYTYITKSSWDPSKPLAWSDLELIDKTLDPPLVAGGPEGPEYRWKVQLPQRSGQHIIYEVWERTDSPEAFYNCSDVVFGGSNTPSPTGTPTATPTGNPSPSDSPTHTPTPTETAVPTPTDTPTSTPTATPTDPGSGAPAECSVKFTTNSWNGGFSVEASVGNDSMTALNGWNVKVVWKNGEQVTQAWNSSVAQSGNTSTFTNAAWNGSVAHHGSFNFGFLGTGTVQTPESITLNGKPCDIY